MRKKKLLSETQVRRFMGLAGIKPLNEMSDYKMDDEKSLTEEEDMEMDAEMGDKPADMPPMGDEDEEPMGDEPEAQIDEEELINAITGAREGLQALESIASSAGINVGGGMKGDMDDEMGDEPADMPLDDEPMEDEKAPETGMDDEDEDMEDELEEVMLEMTEDEIVNEVARRVAKRIVEAKRAHKKMNEALGRRTIKGARPKLRRR